MPTTFKRVISNPEDVGNIQKRVSMGKEEEEHLSERLADATLLAQTDNDDRKMPAAPPVVVECDDLADGGMPNNLDESAGETPILLKQEFRASWSSSSTGSIPSDDRSADNDERGVDDQDDFVGAAAGTRRNEGNLLQSDRNVSMDFVASSARTWDSGQGGSGSGNWGWFEDGDTAAMSLTQIFDISHPQDVKDEHAAAAMAAPPYIRELSLSAQDLWKQTAGNRLPQPEEERAYFEKMWAQNFAMSRVDYKVPVEVLTACTPISFSAFAENHFDTGGHCRELSNYNLATDSTATGAEVAEVIERLYGYTPAKEIEPDGKVVATTTVVKGNTSAEDMTVLIRGDNVFGGTAGKSFISLMSNGNNEIVTVNISIESYRVVESKKHGKFAQFLVIYREGSIRDTIGVWKRYSDFEALSRTVTQSRDSCSSVIASISPLAVTEEPDVEHLPNAITSWRLLKKRQRWFRCLDAGYISVKVFLLERFLHDILFESSSPILLREFVLYDTTATK